MSGVFADNFTAWCLATALELDVELGEPGPAFVELGDALLVWADDSEVEALAARVLDGVWSDGLSAEMSAALERLRDGELHWRRDAMLALDDLARRGRASEIAHAVLERLALAAAQADHDPFVCLCCIDDRIEGRPAEERRAAVLEAAAVACRDAAVPDVEVRAALRESLSPPAAGASGLARRLASDERREAVRSRLRRLARLSRESMPGLSAELEAILGEPMPEDPARDELWREVCRSLVLELEPDLN